MITECHQCKRQDRIGEVLPYYFGTQKGKAVIRWAHQGKCRDALYARWRKRKEGK